MDTQFPCSCTTNATEQALDDPWKSQINRSFGFADTWSLIHLLARSMFLNFFLEACPCFLLFYIAFCIGAPSWVHCLPKPDYLIFLNFRIDHSCIWRMLSLNISKFSWVTSPFRSASPGILSPTWNKPNLHCWSPGSVLCYSPSSLPSRSWIPLFHKYCHWLPHFPRSTLFMSSRSYCVLPLVGPSSIHNHQLFQTPSRNLDCFYPAIFVLSAAVRDVRVPLFRTIRPLGITHVFWHPGPVAAPNSLGYLVFKLLGLSVPFSSQKASIYKKWNLEFPFHEQFWYVMSMGKHHQQNNTHLQFFPTF